MRGTKRQGSLSRIISLSVSIESWSDSCCSLFLWTLFVKFEDVLVKSLSFFT